jgi:hypothetical protein
MLASTIEQPPPQTLSDTVLFVLLPTELLLFYGIVERLRLVDE